MIDRWCRSSARNVRRTRRLAALLAAAGCLAAGPGVALPPAEPDPAELLRHGQPVTSIPTADQVHAFKALDNVHVMLTTSEEKRYLLTLQRDCVGLRWARHVGVTASDNTIWAGFDALTADGEACSIREIHLMGPPQGESL